MEMDFHWHHLPALGAERREAMLDEARRVRLLRAHEPERKRSERGRTIGAAQRGVAWVSLRLGHALLDLGARLEGR